MWTIFGFANYENKSTVNFNFKMIYSKTINCTTIKVKRNSVKM